jgi:hypothetical protein
MTNAATQEAPGGMSLADLAAWHTEQADRAAERALEGFRIAERCREISDGVGPLQVDAVSHEIVATFASAQARFHASAALACMEYA